MPVSSDVLLSLVQGRSPAFYTMRLCGSNSVIRHVARVGTTSYTDQLLDNTFLKTLQLASWGLLSWCMVSVVQFAVRRVPCSSTAIGVGETACGDEGTAGLMSCPFVPAACSIGLCPLPSL